MKIIDQINDISIDKHGLIEASAGTGKTYTIEHLAIRMIREKKITLDQILIVTFTEKATGELRQRLRSKLEEECSNEKNAEILELFHQSLDHFDQTSIFTMHSFCHNVLKDFSFEMAENFQPTIVNNYEVYEAILEKDIRKKWPVFFGENLFNLLNIINFNEASFEDTVLNLCRLMQLHPKFSFTPLPKDISKSLFNALEECVNNILALSPLINLNTFLSGQAISFSGILKGKSVRYFEQKVTQLLQWHQNKKFPLSKIEFAPYSARVVNKKTDMEAYHLVEKIYIQLEKINQIEETANLEFISWNAMEVLNASKIYKTENNLISYDDMILKTEAIISKEPDNTPILQKIRLKYRFGMIDEFQDTDVFQWTIFKTIFIDSPNCKLFLIGDPKQSIYRFRNADIHTYLEAKTLIESLKNENKGELYSLNTNYRSFASLIDDFNFCFNAPSWFGKPNENFNIAYINSKCSNKESKYKRLQSIPKPGFKLVEIKEKNTDEFFKEYSKQIAQEINRLKQDTNVDYGDFCCLFDTKAKMTFVVAELKKAKIPYTIYQEEGISTSKEAIEVSYLLNAIFSPYNEANRALAMMTSFFRIQPRELKSFQNIDANHDIIKMLLSWQNLGQKKQWAKMFHSLFEETGIIAYCLSLPEGERKIANLKQIVEWLEVKAYENKLSLWDLCSLIKDYKSNPQALTDDEKKMRLHTESKKVQLMTIHVSKGLEFPFVFYCKYATSEKAKGKPFWIRRNNQYLIVVDPANDEYLGDFQNEQYEEQKRLMYVTFTRAVHSLYMPFCLESKDEDFKLIIQDYIIQNRDRFETIVSQTPIPKLKPDIKVDRSTSPETKVSWGYTEIPSYRLYDHINIKSYSHLIEKSKSIPQANIDHPDARFDDDQGLEVIADDFPKGANTGNFFHHLFENISFSEVEELTIQKNHYESLLENQSTNQLIEKAMKSYSIDGKWKEAVCKVVFASLTHNLFSFDSQFHLSKLSNKKRIHELEFYYPAQIPKDDIRSAILMKGFIDLIFEWQGKYYILDWKSNYLEFGYEMPALENAMIENEYDLQYSIYSVCLYRWLKERGMKDREWLNKFGGIIYLFLRGTTENQGCYFKAGHELPSIDECLQKIDRRMGGEK